MNKEELRALVDVFKNRLEQATSAERFKLAPVNVTAEAPHVTVEAPNVTNEITNPPVVVNMSMDALTEAVGGIEFPEVNLNPVVAAINAMSQAIMAQTEILIRLLEKEYAVHVNIPEPKKSTRIISRTKDGYKMTDE